MTINQTTREVMAVYQSIAFKRKNDALAIGQYTAIPHDLWRRIIPIAREFGKGNADIAILYSYLLSNVNGDRDNDRYMSAFTSVQRIAADTGLGRNRIAHLSNVLEAVGLLRTCYDYKTNRRDKLYYPMYYSDLTDEQIRENLRKLSD